MMENHALFNPQGATGIATSSTLRHAMGAPINGLEVLRFALRGYVKMEPYGVELTDSGASFMHSPPYNQDPAAVDILQALFNGVTAVKFDKHGQPDCKTGRLKDVTRTRRNRAWQVANGYRVHTRGWHPLRLFTLVWAWFSLAMFLASASTPASDTTARIGMGLTGLLFAIATITNAVMRIYKIAPRGRWARSELKALRTRGPQACADGKQYLLPWLWLVRPRHAKECLKALQPGNWWQGTQDELFTKLPRLIRNIHNATIIQGQPF